MGNSTLLDANKYLEGLIPDNKFIGTFMGANITELSTKALLGLICYLGEQDRKNRDESLLHNRTSNIVNDITTNSYIESFISVATGPLSKKIEELTELRRKDSELLGIL
jgi:hypothetical protein